MIVLLCGESGGGLGDQFAIVPSNNHELQDAKRKLRANMTAPKFEEVNYFNLSNNISEIRYSEWVKL